MIVDKLKEKDMPSHKVILQSFDFDCVKKLANMNLEYELGVLLSKRNIGINYQTLKKLRDCRLCESKL